VPERATVVNRSEKSAEVIVAARRRTEREGESTAMSLGTARHQKPGQPGRTAEGEGEARPEAFRDEAGLARHESEGSGRADLLGQVLARGNLVVAWKRVKANRGSAGVDGLTIQTTAEHLKTHWSQIKEALQNGSYRPQPVRRVQILKVFRELDEWLRHRLRALQLKHWRRGTTVYRELRALGACSDQAARVAGNARRWWRTSCLLLNWLMPIAYFDRLGVPRLS
jgi:hypothetical protein